MEDYLNKPASYKIRKVARYLRLYGPNRTRSKVRAQFHLVRSEGFSGNRWINPACGNPDDRHRRVAIIGCGNFAYSAIAHDLREASRRFLRAAHDILPARARSLCHDYGGYYATTCVDEILSDPMVRLVYIASNHASHADYAIACLEAGKDVHIEKPHAVTQEQLNRLIVAQVDHPGQLVFLGYNRPKSTHFAKVGSVLKSQPGPTMLNWFIAGHRIPQEHWYFSEREGGRVLGNLCHWTDLSLALLGVEHAFPCEVFPVSPPSGRSDFCFGIRFSDGSIASFTFSAKGHTFEGVREVLNAHRGDALISMADFHVTRTLIGEHRSTYRTLFRDHGHGANIRGSFKASLAHDVDAAVDPGYTAATGRLVLAVREALESGHSVQVRHYF